MLAGGAGLEERMRIMNGLRGSQGVTFTPFTPSVVFENTIPLCEVDVKGILLDHQLFKYVTSHPVQ